MSAHTPGPWVVTSGYNGRTTVAMVRSPDRTVCVEAATDAQPPGFDATDANARLIAAAPELLKALKEAVAVARVARDRHGRSLWVPAAEAAIAKAEGVAEEVRA